MHQKRSLASQAKAKLLNRHEIDSLKGGANSGDGFSSAVRISNCELDDVDPEKDRGREAYRQERPIAFF
jgi:hypothetical protein